MGRKPEKRNIAFDTCDNKRVVIFLAYCCDRGISDFFDILQVFQFCQILRYAE